MTPDTCIIQDTNGSADLNTARHGQFQEKEKTPTTQLSIFLSTPAISSRIIIFCQIFLKENNDATQNSENIEDGDFPALKSNYDRQSPTHHRR